MINLKAWLGFTYYTSELSQFLSNFRQKHPTLSASQRKEKEKYERIYKLRDNPAQSETQATFWEKF